MLDKLKERIEIGKSLKYKDIKSDEPSLLHWIDRNGGIANNLIKLGYSESDIEGKFKIILRNKMLTKEEVIERLKILEKENKLTTGQIRTYFGEARLEVALKKMYGNVSKGIELLGFEKSNKKYSTKDKIMNVVYQYKDKDEDLTYANIIKVNPALVSAVRVRFKQSWNDFMLSEFEDFKPIQRKLGREKLKEIGLEIYNQYGKINPGTIKSVDQSVEAQIRYYWDSFDDYYKELGFNPEDILYNGSQLKFFGFKFERKVNDLFKELKLNYKYNKGVGKLRPDFMFPRNVLVDAKLSSWTAFLDNTITKYAPISNKIIILYLRGRKIEKVPDNVEMVQIDELYDFLWGEGLYDFVDYFENLKLEIENLESVTTKRENPSV